MKIKQILITTFLTIISFSNFAQNKDFDEFIVNDKVYKPFANWFKVSGGSSYNIKRDVFEINTNFAFNFRIKKNNYAIGYNISSDELFTQRSYPKFNEIFLCYGWRKETIKSNLEILVGPSFNYGYQFNKKELINNEMTYFYKGFNQIGLYASVDYTYKIFYDIGIGISAFGSLNYHYPVAGIQLHLYLSGALKGKIK